MYIAKLLIYLFVLMMALFLAACGTQTAVEPQPIAEVSPPTAIPPTETAIAPEATATAVPTAVPTETAVPTIAPTIEPVFTELFAITNAPGSLGDPSGVAVDSANNLYIFDAGHSRVLKFDSEGNPLQKWDEKGSSDGAFNSLGFGGIAIDADDNLFVVDNGNFRIQKFDSDGSFVTQWGGEGSEDGQFIRAIGIAVDAAGNVYVTDDGRPEVQVFDNDGNFLRKWGSEGAEDGQFRHATGIAVDADGNVYVSDYTNKRVQKFDNAGNFLLSWKTTGPGTPEGIAIDAGGRVYVTDYDRRRVEVFTQNGEFIIGWGGGESGNFNRPVAIAFDSMGDVYVSNQAGNVVQKFTPPASMIAVPTKTATLQSTTATPLSSRWEVVTIEGVDRITSTATFFPSEGVAPWPGIILLHMSGDDRHVWEENGFADLLIENGYAVLAVDIRNHGKSGGDPSWDNGEADVRRWWNYFTKRDDINGEQTALIGGSIGANLALFTGMQKTAVRTVVLLSPGLDYNSAPVADAVVEYGERPILMVASEDDLFPAVEDVVEMAQLAQGEVQTILYEDAGHGTNMLVAKPELAELILDWLNQTVLTPDAK